MRARRVFVVWGLLATAFLALGTAMLVDWYELQADALFQPQPNFQSEQSEIGPPDVQYHTRFFVDGHAQTEGGSGALHGYEQTPARAEVMSVVRVFYLVGLVGLAVATVGLLFRMRGVVDGKGVIASVAVLSLLVVGFATAHFGLHIAEAYNDDLQEAVGESPEIAFWSLGLNSESGLWKNVTSGPRAGWFLSLYGVGGAAVAFGLVYAADLRRVRAVVVDDEAARVAYQRHTDTRQHVIDRIRREGRP